MLQITREATRYLLRAREERGFDAKAGARFVRTSSGVGLTFALAPEPHDRVVEHRVPIYLDEHLAAALYRSTIDVRSEDGQSRLVLRPHLGAR